MLRAPGPVLPMNVPSALTGLALALLVLTPAVVAQPVGVPHGGPLAGTSAPAGGSASSSRCYGIAPLHACSVTFSASDVVSVGIDPTPGFMGQIALTLSGAGRTFTRTCDLPVPYVPVNGPLGFSTLATCTDHGRVPAVGPFTVRGSTSSASLGEYSVWADHRS